MASDSDNFATLADAAELDGRATSGGGSSWVQLDGTGGVIGATGGGACAAGYPPGRKFYRSTLACGQNQYAQAVITAPSGKTSLAVTVNRANASDGNGYSVAWFGTEWGLYKRVSGTATLLATSASLDPSTGRTVRIYTDGTNVLVDVDGTTIITAALDGAIVGGYPGLGAFYSDGGTLDNWEGGDYSAGAGTPAGADAAQLLNNLLGRVIQ